MVTYRNAYDTQMCVWAELPTQICVSHLNQRWFEFDWSSIENRPVTHHIIRWVPVWTFHRTSVVPRAFSNCAQVALLFDPGYVLSFNHRGEAMYISLIDF